MRLVKQSAVRNVMVFMTQSSDHVSGLTGATLTVTASKDGAAFASISPTVTERGNGWYALALTSSHTDTTGDLAIHVTAPGADPSDLVAQIVAFDPANATSLGLANLDASVSSRASAANMTTALADLDDIQARIPASLVSGRIDASVGAMSSNTVTAAALAADAVAEVQAAILSDATPFPGARIDATVSSRAAVGDAMNLTASGVDLVWDEVVDGSKTARQSWRLANSANAGKTSGAVSGSNGTFVVRDLDDSKDRISATYDSNGNRSSITLDVS